MTTFLKNVFFLVLIWAFFACESVVTNVKLPNIEQKLAITCFISPETDTITATAHLSQPLFGSPDSENASQPLPDANISISDGTKTARFVYDPLLLNYYVGDRGFKIEAGKTYVLVGQRGDKTVKATCTVPLKRIMDISLAMDSSFNRRENYMRYRIKYTWKDFSEKGNYYRVDGRRVYSVRLGTDSITYTQNVFPEGGFPLFTDEESNDENLTRTIVEDRSPGDAPSRVDFLLLHTDVHYHRYHSVFMTYNGDNPFAEPSIIYTNMDGGLGCFGAYRLSVLSREFR